MTHRSGRGNTIAHFSKKPFLNARRFKYLDKYGKEKYIYCDRFPKRISTIKLIFRLAFFLPFFMIAFYIATYYLIPPKPLEPVYELTDVHINDKIGVIEDENGLEDLMQQFEDTTGISPYVVTVSDSEWQGKYDELSEYAYYIYINKFSDEQHFLIVYSEPDNAEELEFVDFSWEILRGDETGQILTEANVNRFGEYLNKNFLIEKISVGEAFENTFKDSLTYMMENSYKNDAVKLIIFLLLYLLGALYLMISTIIEYKMGKLDYLEVPMGDPVKNTADNNFNDDTKYRGSTAYEVGKK